MSQIRLNTGVGTRKCRLAKVLSGQKDPVIPVGRCMLLPPLLLPATIR
ncbi:hypothetical protein [Taibaiella koreensis]|nr:hypothetical protein [Taibaiella koreensis]